MHLRTPKPIVSISRLPPLLDASISNNIFSVVASWLCKIAEEGFSLRSCDDLNLLFKRCSQTMELLSDSYVICDGLNPLLAKEICNDVRNGTSTFPLMFDETTTKQKIQMDILLRYFANLLETRYLLCFFFARAPADFVVKKFQDLRNEK